MFEYHVVVVGRSGKAPGTRVMLLGPGSKPGAIRTAEEAYRTENNLKSNITIYSRCVFSGPEQDGRDFMDLLQEKMAEGN